MEYSNTGYYVSAFGTQQNQAAFGTQQQNQAIFTQPAAGTKQPGEPNFIVVLITSEHFKAYDTICPHCKQQIMTEIHHSIGWYAWLMCAIVFFSGGVGFCFIPFCCNSCKDVTHTCPSCRRSVALYKRGLVNRPASHLKILQTKDYTSSREQGFEMMPIQQFGVAPHATQPPIVQQPGLKAPHTPLEFYYAADVLVVDHFYPYETTCPHCNQRVITGVSYKVGWGTWKLCILLMVSFLYVFNLSHAKENYHIEGNEIWNKCTRQNLYPETTILFQLAAFNSASGPINR